MAEDSEAPFQGRDDLGLCEVVRSLCTPITTMSFRGAPRGRGGGGFSRGGDRGELLVQRTTELCGLDCAKKLAKTLESQLQPPDTMHVRPSMYTALIMSSRLESIHTTPCFTAFRLNQF